jgi:hypothetical protein
MVFKPDENKTDERPFTTYTSHFYKKPMMKWDDTQPNYMRPVTHEIRSRPVNAPKKYNYLLKTKRQIPMKTIKKFVFVTDTSFDNRVTMEDLWSFICKHNLHHYIP